MKKITIFSFVLIAFLYSCNTSELGINTNINSEKIISNINNGKQIVFVEKQISGKINFSKINNIYTFTPAIAVAEVNVPITFVGCTFTDSIVGFYPDSNFAYVTIFNKPVTFIKCTFEKAVNFRQNTFNQDVVFAQCNFVEESHFEGSVFNGNTNDFKEVTYGDYVKFTNASFYGNANFMNSEFSHRVDFNNCFFNRNVSFSASNFVLTADFTNLSVNGDFKANYANFSEKAYFDNCSFYNKSDFVKIITKGAFILKNSSFYNDANFNKMQTGEKLIFSNNYFFTTNSFDEFSVLDSCYLEIENNYKIGKSLFEITVDNVKD